MGAHAYAVTNALTGLAASAFTFSAASTTNRTYLNDRRMDQVFAATSNASGITLVIDMGSATSLAGFAVLNSNASLLGGAPTLRVRAADDDAISVSVVTLKDATTLNLTAPYHKDHVLQFSAASKRYWELAWTWTGTSILRIGELFAFAASTSLTRRSIYGSGERHEAIVTHVQMQYGETRSSFQGGPVRTLVTQWDDLTATERGELYTMHTASSFGAVPLLWIASKEAVSTAAANAEQECIYGKLVKPGFEWTERDYGLYQPGGLDIRSLGREAGA